MSPMNQFPHGVRGPSPAPARAKNPTKLTRKDFTDKLDLPHDATNAQVFAALDARLAARAAASPASQAPSTSQRTADDALYDLVYGDAGAAATDSAQNSELYKALFGESDG